MRFSSSNRTRSHQNCAKNKKKNTAPFGTLTAPFGTPPSNFQKTTFFVERTSRMSGMKKSDPGCFFFFGRKKNNPYAPLYALQYLLRDCLHIFAKRNRDSPWNVSFFRFCALVLEPFLCDLSYSIPFIHSDNRIKKVDFTSLLSFLSATLGATKYGTNLDEAGRKNLHKNVQVYIKVSCPNIFFFL